ncbi:16S rRNA (cytosine(1402)-N(4))-methyltransferase RsmH [Sporohalobacter salinus]|uniref:16S rRNA (cytosine(1402)-N(4))-methyltransferase RsmH n=1 Tax=Sporohalobacter salinus TaxID=1494606 RepID=UPI0019603F0E|nr:16S rRNA (cytosine(1402)-N(4))-methyltransferase RsmH [Sporohalobacter salinus]MBM7624372.1 16S rRNA (cytosine1402-N4)-methyltransferase [Sporohalobacter salinus]
MDFDHIPVLLTETIELLNCKKDGIYVDCTVGGGGHAVEIASNLTANGTLIGIDQDLAAIKAAKESLSEVECEVKLVRDNYKNVDKVLNKFRIDSVDGLLFDLGFSSHQIDTAQRGFSYRYEAPLDMRMDQRASTTAADLVNNLSQSKLTDIIAEYGEEKWASRIAEFIVNRRQEQPFELTTELVETIKAAIPAGARRNGPHPAKRTFQALRIAVNDELEILSKTLDKIVPLLRSEGRIAVITFHSLEDRIVKHKFKELAQDCICPPDFPICACDEESKIEIINKQPITAQQEEIDNNPRARSAKLRVAEKL